MHDIDFRHDLLPLKDKLFRLALRITRHTAEAEDVTSDTLIRVWNKRSELSEIKNIEAYCYSICRNLSLDRIALKESQNLSIDTQQLQTASDDSITADLEERESIKHLHQLINALPERQRTIVQLRDIEGMSYADIASTLHVSEGVVKVTLHRARQTLKQAFIKYQNYGL